MSNAIANQALTFRDATRQQCKASILIEGLTGEGKSGLALLLGRAFAGGDFQKTFAIDTENKSLDLFDGIQLSTGDKCTPFKKLDLLPTYGYAPSTFIDCKHNAVAAGALAVINDSITHMWQREGGVLEMVSKLEKANGTKYNKYTAWGEPTVVAEKQAIIDVVRDSRVHVISTVRIKEKHSIETVDGKSVVKSLGDQQIQMPDLKYEPDLVLRMVSPGSTKGDAPVATVIKSRYVIFEKGKEYAFTETLIQQLVEYLLEGSDPAELLELQRQEFIHVISEMLDRDPGKKTMFPILKEQQGFKDTKLIDLPLDALRILLGVMIN